MEVDLRPGPAMRAMTLVAGASTPHAIDSTCATLHRRTPLTRSLSLPIPLHLHTRLPPYSCLPPPPKPTSSTPTPHQLGIHTPRRTRVPHARANASHTPVLCVRHARAAQNIECGKECSCSLAAPGFPTTPPNERLHEWRQRQRWRRPVERLCRLQPAHR